MATRTVQHLRDHLAVFEPEFPIQKGYVARLLLDKRSLPDVVAEIEVIVKTTLPEKQVNTVTLRKYVYDFKIFLNKKRNLTAEWQKLIRLFIQPFPIIFKSLPVASASSQLEHGHTSPAQHLEPTSSVLSSEVSLEQDTLQTSATETYSAPMNLPECSGSSELPSPKKLKADCPNCVNQRRSVMHMAQQNRRLQKNLTDLRKRQRDQKPANVPRKRLTEMLKKKTQLADKRQAKLIALKEKYEDAETRLKCSDIWQQRANKSQAALSCREEEVKTLKQYNKQLNTLLGKQNKRFSEMGKKHIAFKKDARSEYLKAKKIHKTQINELTKSFSQSTSYLQNKVALMEEQMADTSMVIDTKKEGVYDWQIRKCVYDLLCKNVSSEHVGSVLQNIVRTFSNKSLSSVPCASTVQQMMFELYVVADIHVGQVLNECKCATLGWDGTTKGGKHLNEVHVSVTTSEDKQLSLTINVSSIPGGTTKDIATHIHQSVDDICETYIAAFDLNCDSVKKIIYNKFKFTMSDRAAVNHAVHNELQKVFGDVVELKCSVHPLDGLANAARKG